MMVLCTGLLVGCDKEQDEYKPIKPPTSQPEEPNEPVSPPSTNDIISFKIGDTSMIIGTNTWNGITYGNGRYAVVGDSGYVTSSVDGITWDSPKTITGANNWLSVAFGKDKFVAIDWHAPSNVMTSTDGINWTKQSDKLPHIDNRYYNAIRFCNGMFIAVGTAQISTSTNGTTWTRRWQNSYIYEPQDITYGNGKYVTGVGGGNVLTSSDGITWAMKQHQCLIGGYYIYGIAFGNGKFVMVGTKGITARSTDGGETWEVPSIFVSKKNWRGVIFSNGKFIAISVDGYVTTSTDGITWKTLEALKDESGNVVTAQLNGVCAMP
ncbi:sialidase family protein [uncultured Bacteroides sp.]|uniref:WD40/YVTN/BNR-like repeat-containing protein n=1 Tax=uncultured Bacteroides sp. TaxID=162156 RepID=UPI00280B0F1D|nr:sialidase family protein [uncultured Bacteroides sp.]